MGGLVTGRELIQLRYSYALDLTHEYCWELSSDVKLENV